MLGDTIVAVSTPLGFGGLGIVRLSGKKSLTIAKRIFKYKHNKGISPGLPVLGKLYDYVNKEFFDEAYLTFFQAPSTYTREDIVEISCHGSPVILEEVIRLCTEAGARHAGPGEFTLRAFLNGRIDILQAEAINDLIHATSRKQAQISFRQIGKTLSKRIYSLRYRIIHVLSQIETSIEFPEEALKISPKKIAKTLEETIRAVTKLVESYDIGKTLTEGVNLSLAGRANVGKSTFFNAIIQKNRAIVTPYPGTTRDYLHETIRIKDSFFTLTDMAGLDKTLHPIEKEGIKRGKQIALKSDGILMIFDVSKNENKEDFELLKEFAHKKLFLLFNKIDLPRKMNIDRIKDFKTNLPWMEISALKKTNLEELKHRIHKRFVPQQKMEGDVILQLRQKLLLEEILAFLTEGLQILQEGYTEEVYAEEIKKTLPLIGQLTGEIRKEEILEDIFSRFCIGK